jgi:hypothetical protein
VAYQVAQGKLSCDWEASWRAAMPSLLRMQRQDRERDRGRPRPPSGPREGPPVAEDRNPYDGPTAREERRKRDEDARSWERRAVPPPPDLMAAIAKRGAAQ